MFTCEQLVDHSYVCKPVFSPHRLLVPLGLLGLPALLCSLWLLVLSSVLSYSFTHHDSFSFDCLFVASFLSPVILLLGLEIWGFWTHSYDQQIGTATKKQLTDAKCIFFICP